MMDVSVAALAVVEARPLLLMSAFLFVVCLAYMARVRIVSILETKVLDLTTSTLTGIDNFVEPPFVSAFYSRRVGNAVLCTYLVCRALFPFSSWVSHRCTLLYYAVSVVGIVLILRDYVFCFFCCSN